MGNLKTCRFQRCTLLCGLHSEQLRGPLEEKTLKQSEIFWTKYFSINSENDDANSSCSHNSNNIVYFPSTFMGSQIIYKHHLIFIKTPYFLLALLSTCFSYRNPGSQKMRICWRLHNRLNTAPKISTVPQSPPFCLLIICMALTPCESLSLKLVP